MDCWDEAEAEVKTYRDDLLFAFQAIRLQVQARKRRLTSREVWDYAKRRADTITGEPDEPDTRLAE